MLKSSSIQVLEAAITAAQAMSVNARTVIERLSKVAREVAGYADSAVQAAAAVTAKAVKNTAK